MKFTALYVTGAALFMQKEYIRDRSSLARDIHLKKFLIISWLIYTHKWNNDFT